jgi:hypothetical protein
MFAFLLLVDFLQLPSLPPSHHTRRQNLPPFSLSLSSLCVTCECSLYHLAEGGGGGSGANVINIKKRDFALAEPAQNQEKKCHRTERSLTSMQYFRTHSQHATLKRLKIPFGKNVYVSFSIDCATTLKGNTLFNCYGLSHPLQRLFK